MILHPRGDWVNWATWNRHALMDPNEVVGIAWHYPGIPHLDVDGLNDVLEAEDTRQILRNMDTAYRRDRGYNLGYGWAIDQLGHVWEIRGVERQAANGNQTANRKYLSVLFVLPTLDAGPSNAAINAARELVRYLVSHFPKAKDDLTHDEARRSVGLPGTTCCGPIIGRLVHGGTFRTLPIPPAPIEEDDMASVFRLPGSDRIYVQSADKTIRHVSAGEGAVAAALNPAWAEASPVIDVPPNVREWLEAL